jgi:diguanylate cyclase (GGDEF)-like protein
MDSLFAMLFWCNAISSVFMYLYYLQSKLSRERRLTAYLIAARVCHAFYYFVASGRDILPDWLSVSIGNSVMLLGFFFEAHAILRVVKENRKLTDAILLCALALSLFAFNLVELLTHVNGYRIALASLGVVVVMALPTVRMLLSRDSSTFTKSTSVLYCVFLCLLLMRAAFAVQNESEGILTTNLLHSITFLSLLLQLMIALPAYTLIIKEHSHEALLLMATTDSVTGITNRHAFLDAADAIHHNCLRLKKSLSVLFIDIDHFKGINDRYGHAFGDEVLVRLAATIDCCLRGSDLHCRFGGEEFVALLPGANTAMAESVAARIKDGVGELRFEAHPDFSFTISIGIASGVPLKNFEDIIALADAAMYDAKHAGRNRVVTVKIGKPAMLA